MAAAIEARSKVTPLGPTAGSRGKACETGQTRSGYFVASVSSSPAESGGPVVGSLGGQLMRVCVGVVGMGGIMTTWARLGR